MWALLTWLVIATWLLVDWRRSGKDPVNYFVRGLVVIYSRLWHGWSSNGMAPVPAQGPAILVSNHSCSADSAFLTTGCRRILSFLIAEEYYELKPVIPLYEYMGCVPICRTGSDAIALRRALRRLSEGRVLCIFPEGGLSNAGQPRPRRCARGGVALLALRSRAPVFPALILRGPQTRRIVPAWIRPSRVRVVFGPALDLSAYYDRPINRKLLEEVTAYIMQHVADLRHMSRKPLRRQSS
jgi:1-acyl-sn-glycerol-3-phosphate acyltransferase